MDEPLPPPPTPVAGTELAFGGYHSLMPNRVRDILLVASPYDCFILEEDGRFTEQIYSQYGELHLSSPPRFHQVSRGGQALDALGRMPVDLIITTPHCADMSPLELAEAVRRRRPALPVIMLTYDRLSAQTYADLVPEAAYEEVFCWTGDPALLLAMVKSVEDRLNVAHDTAVTSVRVILVVEDSPAFYSAYLPVLYTEVYAQTQALLADTVNEADRVYRMRARPKILLARTYEGAMRLVERYRPYLQGVVTDMRFPRGGTLDRDAGRALIGALRAAMPDLPILLQSSEPDHVAVAARLGVAFLEKQSPALLAQLREFMQEDLGFGPFVFRTPDGREIARAADIPALMRTIDQVPDACIRHHGERHHFSHWLMTRCEFQLAAEVHSWHVDDFATMDDARRRLRTALSQVLEIRQRGQVTDYRRGTEMLRRDFTRLGRGSMGGKARGLAFMSQQLARHPLRARFPGVRVFVPRSTVICTEVFEQYVAATGLRGRALAATDDEQVRALFLAEPLPDTLMEDLAAFLAEVRYPLAVRSSSLLEDSAFAPLAGLYDTKLVPNRSTDDAVRLQQLATAIKLVYASTFFQSARRYMQAASLRLEEERMGVILQRLIGTRHGPRFYPDFAGTAQSRNFYPIRYCAPEDGVATVALGLGHTVVDGGRALRFCPRYPEVVPQLSSPGQALRESQAEFRALDLTAVDDGAGTPRLARCPLEAAEADGTLPAVASVYDADNDRLVDSLATPGPRVVTFAPVLKYDRFPLARLLGELLALGASGLGTDVEMEFAVALGEDDGRSEFAFLQLRPLVAALPGATPGLAPREGERVWLRGPALGAGVIPGLGDVVYMHPDRWAPSRTQAAAAVIDAANSELLAAGRPYVLAAPGRWGTADPSLGIPVIWSQVSGARVIAELAIPGFRVDPSQGTHFFHNVTSLRVGYFSLDLAKEPGALDFDWLESLPAVREDAGVRHVRLPAPAEARLDGRARQRVVSRPE